MIWYLLIIVIAGALMGFFQIPIWVMYCLLFVLFMFNILNNPLLFGRNPEKIMAFLRKSKRPYLQFLFHFLNYDLLEAERTVRSIRSEKTKALAELMLFMERKQFGEAKEKLGQMGENKTKWFAAAYISLYEGEMESFIQNKARVSDSYQLQMLEVEQAVLEGKREKAITMLEAMVPKLTGYKLVSVIQFQKHILDGNI